ncbi:uncharacterized protein KZ484_020184 isoform 2-T2 [Pholidichthys leucotaenia]
MLLWQNDRLCSTILSTSTDTMITSSFAVYIEGLLDEQARGKWLKPGSKLMVRLEKVMSSTTLLKDIRQIFGQEQTSSLEAFHSLPNHFAPKTYSFSYRGQLCRTLLTVMHFNENAERAQKTTVAGKEKFGLYFPKWKKGGYVVRKLLGDPTFDYAADVVTEVLALCQSGDEDQPAYHIEEPLPLSSDFHHPDKDTAVAERYSRY